ncbi:uncharacterized protein LOC106729829 [Camelus ferus]|uniref:Uncharacterized protein LOC106729829 n=1 Tax=Camelus ferus TaxID=419612 RepID=A0A8B8U6T4_CAMFR|nr:uncharacterized protein LOC106729829 [Camelus ferus]
MKSENQRRNSNKDRGGSQRQRLAPWGRGRDHPGLEPSAGPQEPGRSQGTRRGSGRHPELGASARGHRPPPVGRGGGSFQSGMSQLDVKWERARKLRGTQLHHIMGVLQTSCHVTDRKWELQEDSAQCRECNMNSIRDVLNNECPDNDLLIAGSVQAEWNHLIITVFQGQKGMSREFILKDYGAEALKSRRQLGSGNI